MESPLADGLRIVFSNINLNNKFSRAEHLIEIHILGLFSRAIAQSGINLAPWSLPAYAGVAKERAKQLADSLDCYKSNDWSGTMECLRNVPAKNITAALYDFFVCVGNFAFNLFLCDFKRISYSLHRYLISIQWCHSHLLLSQIYLEHL